MRVKLFNKIKNTNRKYNEFVNIFNYYNIKVIFYLTFKIERKKKCNSVFFILNLKLTVYIFPSSIDYYDFFPSFSFVTH